MSKLMSAVLAPLGRYVASCAQEMVAPSTWLIVLQGMAPGIVLGLLFSPFMVAWCLTHPPGSISVEQADAFFMGLFYLVGLLFVAVCVGGAALGIAVLVWEFRRGPK